MGGKRRLAERQQVKEGRDSRGQNLGFCRARGVVKGEKQRFSGSAVFEYLSIWILATAGDTLFDYKLRGAAPADGENSAPQSPRSLSLGSGSAFVRTTEEDSNESQRDKTLSLQTLPNCYTSPKMYPARIAANGERTENEDEGSIY